MRKVRENMGYFRKFTAILMFPSPLLDDDITEILLKVVLDTIKQTNINILF
jgi:hypothetical protein